MTNKQIKNSCVDFFNVLKFSRFIAQPCSYRACLMLTIKVLRFLETSVVVITHRLTSVYYYNL